MKRHAGVDLPATARLVDDDTTSHQVFTHPSAAWYREQSTLSHLVADAPMVEVRFGV